MRAQQILWTLTGAAMLAGCASNDLAQTDTLNEPPERMQANEDRRPPNPNLPPDTRELKSVPTVVQHDPALNQPDKREDKGLSVNAGKDQLIRPQDPTRTPEAETPKAVGGAAASEQGSVAKPDSDLVARVKEAISSLKNQDANLTPGSASQTDATNGEKKAVQNLEVTAKNGAITLSGSVDSEAERTSIEQAATRVSGVNSVTNALVVARSNPQ